MLDFNVHIELDAADACLVAAVARVTRQTDVRVLDSWWWSKKGTDVPSEEETGAVNIEWYMRKGRFKLDVHLFGPGLPQRESTARFARALARELGRDMLFSDCGLFGQSYFLAAADGAIWYVVVDNYDDDRMDLLPADPAMGDYFVPQLIAAADVKLPCKPAIQPLDSAGNLAPAYKARCDTDAPGLICEPFWGRCPKHDAGLLGPAKRGR